MPDRDHEPDSQEDVDLAELDRVLVLVVLRSLVDDQVEPVVALDLGTLVRFGRVLDREFVQAEKRC